MADAAIRHPANDDGERISLVERAYLSLRNAILASDFAPGHQFSAQDLASRFGMSRTPIHEACLRLQEEGLVRILPKKGILVCALSPEDVREIYDVIIAIEGDAAALAARLPEAERRAAVAALSAINDEMEAAQDFESRGEADTRFHRMLAQCSGNSRFVAIMKTVNNQAHRARVFMVQLRPNIERSVPEHRAIIEAIRLGDPQAAFVAARHHRERARDDILPMLMKFGLKHL